MRPPRGAGLGARLLTTGLVLASCLWTHPAAAQTSARADADGVDMVPVTLDGRLLFRVPGFSTGRADERATAIAGRIARAAADPILRPEDVRVVDDDGRVALQAGDIRLMSITPEDAKLVGASASTIGEFCRGQIVSAIQTYREERQPRALLRAGGKALVATIVFVVLLWIVNRMTAWLVPRVVAAWQSRIAKLQHEAFRIVRLERFDSVLLTGVGLLRVLLWLALAVPFVQYTFDLFPWTRSIARDLGTILLGPLQTIALGLVGFLPNAVFLAVLFVVVRLTLRLGRAAFDAIEQGTLTIRNFDPEWAQPTFRIVRVFIIAFAVIVGYPYLPGSGSDAFKGVSLFLGLVFSLGSSSALSNIIAGYSLQYRRAFRVGDVIRIGSDFGSVTQVRLQVTHMRTVKNEEIIIPNSTILTSNVVNFSHLVLEHGLILHTEVGVGYETPWRQVEAMLLAAAAGTDGLMREPPPFVHQKKLGDFAVTYELNAYCDNPRRQLELYSRLHRNILDQFNEYGVQIMTPAYEGDPKDPKVVPKSQWFLPPADKRGQNGVG